MKYSEIALFTDLDGTLFDSRSTVSEKNKEASLGGSPPREACSASPQAAAR